MFYIIRGYVELRSASIDVNGAPAAQLRGYDEFSGSRKSGFRLAWFLLVFSYE
jgi:hypothetical protein